MTASSQMRLRIICPNDVFPETIELSVEFSHYGDNYFPMPSFANSVHIGA